MLEKQKLSSTIAMLDKQVESERAIHREKEFSKNELEIKHKDVIRAHETTSDELLQ